MNAPSAKIITDWDKYLSVIINTIQNRYAATRAKDSRHIVVYTQANRTEEVIKLFDLGNRFLKIKGGSLFTITKKNKPSRSVKTETITITAGKDKWIDIVFKPLSSFRGAGKENELAFLRIMEMAKADSTKESPIMFKYIDEFGRKAPPIHITPETPVIMNTKNNKADIVVGSVKISLKDVTADYVASLNKRHANVAHHLIRSLVKERGSNILSFDGSTVSINKKSFPYKAITDRIDRNFVLFGTGSTSFNKEIDDIDYNTDHANIVLVNNFMNPLDVDGKRLYISGQSPYERKINKIIIRESDAVGKYDIFFYLRNDKLKGQAFREIITNYNQLNNWMINNPNKVPKGLRLQAAFRNKLKEGDIEIL